MWLYIINIVNILYVCIYIQYNIYFTYNSGINNNNLQYF